MGANITQRLMRGGHQLFGFDPKPEGRKDLEDKGAEPSDSLVVATIKTELVRALRWTDELQTSFSNEGIVAIQVSSQMLQLRNTCDEFAPILLNGADFRPI